MPYEYINEGGHGDMPYELSKSLDFEAPIPLTNPPIYCYNAPHKGRVGFTRLMGGRTSFVLSSHAYCFQQEGEYHEREDYTAQYLAVLAPVRAAVGNGSNSKRGIGRRTILGCILIARTG